MVLPGALWSHRVEEPYDEIMSIAARFEDGVFRPLEPATGAVPGKVYRVFSEEELQSLNEGLDWLKAAEPSFAFWNNEDDAVYDRL